MLLSYHKLIKPHSKLHWDLEFGIKGGEGARLGNPDSKIKNGLLCKQHVIFAVCGSEGEDLMEE